MSNLISRNDSFSLNYEFLYNVKSHHTREAYRRDLQHFAYYIHVNFEDVKSIQDIKIIHLIKYKEDLLKDYAPKTVNRKLACMSSYFDFLITKSLVTVNPTRGIKRPHSHAVDPTEALTDEEIERFLEVVEKNNHPMHKLLINIFLTCGIRRAEVVNIKFRDIKLNAKYPHITIIGKGSKKLDKVINQMTIRYLNDWISHLNSKHIYPENDDYVFKTYRKDAGVKLRADSVYKIVKRYADKSSITKNVSPHTFRSSYITASIEAGISPEIVQMDAGHASIETTMSYVRKKRTLDESPVHKISYLKKA